MTSREIIDNLLRGKPADRVGLCDAPWADTLRKWTDDGYPVDDAGEPVDPALHFDFDLTCVGGWFDIVPLPTVNEVVEETDEWVIRRNGAGAVHKWWKNKSGTPEHLDFAMTSRKIWDRDYRPHLLQVDRRRLYQPVKDDDGNDTDELDIAQAKTLFEDGRRSNKWTFYGNVFVWENMRQSMGDVCLYRSLIDDPAWIHDYNRVYTDMFKSHLQVLFDEIGIPDGYWMYEDLGYSNGLFCSPRILEELIFPYFKEMVGFFHDRDIPVVLHSCGCVTEALPLIVDAGFDGLNPMEVKAGCDVLKYAEQYGDRLAFIGGLDARILESGDRDLIRNEVVRLVEGMKRIGARYVFGSDHSISTNVRYADFQYALDVYREHMMY